MSTKRPTSVVIDPVAMNISNKISKDSVVAGDYKTGGGLLIEGTYTGNLTVADGPLVLIDGGQMSGCIEVLGDAYIFGKIGTDVENSTIVTVRGELHLTSKCEVHGKVIFAKLTLYDGANIHGVVMESMVQATNKE